MATGNTRPRPYRNLGGDELVTKLFEVAFMQEAAAFEDVRYEIVGSADGNWRGRTSIHHVPQLVEAAKRVLEMNDSPPSRLGAPQLLSLVREMIECGVMSCEDVVHHLHGAAYSKDVADALRDINQRVLRLVE